MNEIQRIKNSENQKQFKEKPNQLKKKKNENTKRTKN